MARPARRAAICTVASLALIGTSAVRVSAAGSGEVRPLDAQQRATLAAGLQTAPKRADIGQATAGDARVRAANPWLANLPNPQDVDWAFWKSQAKLLSADRAKSSALVQNKLAQSAAGVYAPLVHDEQEPASSSGYNDSQPSAEVVTGFGTGPARTNAARVLGALSDQTPALESLPPGAEDNGSIPLATDTGIDEESDGIETTGVLGDGPHGTTGDNTNDFDVYRVGADAGESISASTSLPATPSTTDTVLALYDASGTLVDVDDDGGDQRLTSQLTYPVRTAGDYYVLVAGYASDPLPDDPFDSGSGNGGGDTGPYGLTITASTPDVDYFAVDLRKGDVLGASLAGAAGRLVVHRTDGAEMVGSTQDASFIYAPEAPLPGGGNAVLAYVAEAGGRYAVSVEEGVGSYDLTLEAYRPGPQTEASVQTVFLDFDGGRVNTSIWGGRGVSDLSPFSAFLGRWGLSTSDEAEMTSRITNVVTENIKRDLIAKGLNERVAVRVLNSRDHADPFGRRNVSRVIIGGTIEQSGINTIGIAQYIDPGNYANEDSALVLLDVLSDPVDISGPATINSYLTSASDTKRFIAQVVGNVTSHEIGHLVGSFHVDQFNDIDNLMDQGGNFPLLYGVGPDGIGGTDDDVDVDFGEDYYNPNEGFTGLEDTLNVTAWAFSAPRR